MKKYKIRFKNKAMDSMVRVDSLKPSDRERIESFDETITYVSYDPVAGVCRIIDHLNSGHNMFTGEQIRSAFAEEPDPVFQYLSKLNDHDLWIEINRTKKNVKASEPAQRYLLGLFRFSYHHASRTTKVKEKSVPSIDEKEVFDLFQYTSIERLIQDIRMKEQMNENISS